ncbi:hypothetical protein SUGI_0118680 [Cryptomeria japonica]|nr:hypothetical protein SUGI_0118680 [Cryptomeria japonica]
MGSELQEAACDKQSDVVKDNSPRKSVKWRIMEVNWDDNGVKQTRSEESDGNIGRNTNLCTEVGTFSTTGVFEIDLSECIENEKVIFDQHAIIAKILGPKLSRKEIHTWVLEQRGRHIMSWSPNFDPTSMAGYDKPMWIRLYNLSIEYRSEACLEMIRRSLGTLLKIDEEIVEGDLYTYARLRIAAIKAIPPSVMLLTADRIWKQHIEIEKEIEVCSWCGSKFHDTANCRMFVRKAYKHPGKKMEQVWKTKEKTQVQETLLLEGPKTSKCMENKDA